MLGWSECSATKNSDGPSALPPGQLTAKSPEGCLCYFTCVLIGNPVCILVTASGFQRPPLSQTLPLTIQSNSSSFLTQFLSTCSVYMTLKQGSSRSRTMGLSALHKVSDALAVHEELARCVGCSGREKVSGTNTQMLPALSFPDLCPRSGLSSRLPRS